MIFFAFLITKFPENINGVKKSCVEPADKSSNPLIIAIPGLIYNVDKALAKKKKKLSLTEYIFDFFSTVSLKIDSL